MLSVEFADIWVQFLEFSRRLVDFVKAEEPGTLAYFITRSVSDPEVYLFFERYESKAANDKHLESSLFQQWEEMVGNGILQDVEISKSSMEVGFLTKPGCETIAPTDYFWVAELTFQPGCRDRGITLIRKVAQDSLAKEPGTVTYAMLKHTSEPQRITIFERYTAKSALEDVHFKGLEFVAMRRTMESESLLAKRVPNAYMWTGIGYMQKYPS